jgi:hypothetical protein
MWRLAVVMLVMIGLMACERSTGNAKTPKELETVDVGGGFDAGLTTEFDEKARQVAIELGGVLPSDFPAAMPTLSPASVVDFGPGFVELDTPLPLSEAQSSLGGQIQRAGWTIDSVGEGGSLYSRDGQKVRVTLAAAGTGTRIRYEY